MGMRYRIEVMRSRSINGVTDTTGIRIAILENDQITSGVSDAIASANRAVGTDSWDYLNLISDFRLSDGTLVQEFQTQRIRNPSIVLRSDDPR